MAHSVDWRAASAEQANAYLNDRSIRMAPRTSGQLASIVSSGLQACLQDDEASRRQAN